MSDTIRCIIYSIPLPAHTFLPTVIYLYNLNIYYQVKKYKALMGKYPLFSTFFPLPENKVHMKLSRTELYINNTGL